MKLRKRKYSLTTVSNGRLTAGLQRLLLLSLVLLAPGLSTLAFAHGNHSNQQAAIHAEFVVLQVTKQGPQIKRIDTDGHEQVLYTVPKGDRLYQFQHAQNKPQLLISYQQQQTGLQGIWTMDYSQEQQQELPQEEKTEEETNQQNNLMPILVDKDPNTYFFDPLFAREGGGIYYVSAGIDEKTGRASKDLALRFYEPQNNQQQLIAKNATHPSISGSGKFLSWIEQQDAFREVKVQQIGIEDVQTYRITNPKTIVRFSKVNEQLNTLFFFSNKEKLLAANSMLPPFSLKEVLLPKAHAHSGHKHAHYFGWQISLDNKDLAQSKQNWEVSDIRAFDISTNGKYAAWLNSDGLHVVDLATGKPLKTIKNPNYWKLVYVN